MISIEGLKVEFGVTPLFEDVSFVINKKDRIALVGKNGAGKSTMLKILAGLQQPTEGNVAVQRGVTIGYLPQVMILSDTRTVMAEAEMAFEHIFELQDKLAKMNQELADRTDYDSDGLILIVLPVSSVEDGVCVLSWQSCCYAALMYCCWTSRPTIWILKVFNGWKTS